jgi:hypothetical protein
MIRTRAVDGRRRAVFDGSNQAITTAATVVLATSQQAQQTGSERQQQSAMHSFPTFPVYNRGIS